MHRADRVGAGPHDVLVAALELRPAEVLGPEIEPLDIGAEGAVKHDDALGENLLEELDPVRIGRHCEKSAIAGGTRIPESSARG